MVRGVNERQSSFACEVVSHTVQGTCRQFFALRGHISPLLVLQAVARCWPVPDAGYKLLTW